MKEIMCLLKTTISMDFWRIISAIGKKFLRPLVACFSMFEYNSIKFIVNE